MSIDIYIALVTINISQLAPINSAYNLTKSLWGRQVYYLNFLNMQADSATVPRSDKESTMESAAQPLSCKAHIYSQALPSATSSAQLLIWVDDNAVNVHSVLTCPPSCSQPHRVYHLHQTSVGNGWWALSIQLNTGKQEAEKFLGFFWSKLRRKED